MTALSELGIRLGSKANPLVLSLTVYEGVPYVDIRKCFLKKADGMLQPTRKGLTLGSTLLRELQKALQENQSEIFEWLESGGNETLQNAAAAMKARSLARDEEASRARPFTVERGSTTAPQFCRVETHGGEDKLVFNSKHPLETCLAKHEYSTTEVREIIALIVVSFYRARLRFPGQIEAEAAPFFDALEFEWGVILRNYLQNIHK